jgi:hypothetical protein
MDLRMLAHLENILSCYDTAHETGKATLSGKEIDAIRETVSIMKNHLTDWREFPMQKMFDALDDSITLLSRLKTYDREDNKAIDQQIQDNNDAMKLNSSGIPNSSKGLIG